MNQGESRSHPTARIRSPNADTTASSEPTRTAIQYRIADPTLLDSVSDPIRESVVALIVTDRKGVATSSDEEVVLINDDLVAIMRVMSKRLPFGLLHPRDLSENRLTALACGTRVFSVFTPDDLKLERPHYNVLKYVAQGYSRKESGRLAGYSPRHVSRILKNLTEEARLTSDFRWPRLAPILGS